MWTYDFVTERSWIGNSPAVAMQYYAQVTEADLQEAAKMTLLDDAEKTMQNSMQTTAEQGRTDSHKSTTDNDVSPFPCETKPEKTIACDSVRNAGNWAGLDSNQRRLTPMGLQPQLHDPQSHPKQELNDITDGLLQENLQDCSECIKNALPGELFEVVCEWENLPEHIRQTIRMLVETAGKKSKNT